VYLLQLQCWHSNKALGLIVRLREGLHDCKHQLGSLSDVRVARDLYQRALRVLHMDGCL
jgi:hypothetical protein